MSEKQGYFGVYANYILRLNELIYRNKAGFFMIYANFLEDRNKFILLFAF